MRTETRTAMEMLYSAKWNVPKAAAYCNLTIKECKIVFSEYCRLNPPTYGQETFEEKYISLPLFSRYRQLINKIVSFK